jgi:Glycosyl hydrolase catalytic core
MHSLRAGRRSVARKPARRVAMGVAAALTLMSGSAAVANAAAPVARPVLNAHGHKLSWPAAAKVSKYVLATTGHGKSPHASYRVLRGTSFTPPAVAGQTMKYELRANTSASRWSKTVSIKYSAKPATAPAAAAPAKAASAAVSSSSMMVGLNSGWGTMSASDMQGSFGLARIDTSEGGTETPSTYHADGIKVIATFPGDVGGSYDTGGVSAINIPNWVSMATTYYASQCMGSTDYCPAIEVLNEPYGSWFWGANAADAQNEAAYANLVKAVHQAFQAKYGSGAPQILAAYDKTSGWWAGMVAAVPNITSYFDGVVVHPYGGTGTIASSALGNRALVTEAHTDTGKPDWITEFGWPTAVGQPATGDSLQWNQTQQATNIYNFVNWARSTGYVSALTYFNYRDYGTNNWYGVENGAGTKKLGWTALAESAASQACTVCSA